MFPSLQQLSIKTFIRINEIIKNEIEANIVLLFVLLYVYHIHVEPIS